MTEHGPALVLPRDDGGLLVRCLCGVVGGGAKGLWKFEYDGAGKVQARPSIDMKGCFHTPNPSGWWPLAKSSDDLFDEPAPGDAPREEQ